MRPRDVAGDDEFRMTDQSDPPGPSDHPGRPEPPDAGDASGSSDRPDRPDRDDRDDPDPGTGDGGDGDRPVRGEGEPSGRTARGSSDPSVVRFIAVSVDDVVAALEARRRGGHPVVLRLTPPFSGRMRARLHVRDDGEYGSGDPRKPRPLHIDPGRLVESPPPYPEVDETGDELRATGDYSTEAHRERHAEAVREWRRTVRESVVDRAELDLPDGTHEVSVVALG